ncbi:MAG: hypothetical protein HOV87_26365 [Catenulispora sp.]|nr:hypothetical protein [Catenulispora sp.]
MGAGSGVRFGGRIGAGAAAAALVLGLPACTSSTSDVLDTESPAPRSTSADPLAPVRAFCADLQTESRYGAPVIGSPMTAEALALLDRLAAEAPPAVRDAMQAADAAAHDEAQQATADGMRRLGDAMEPVTTWASIPANCPPGRG